MEPVTRRQFVVGSAAGLAGILATRVPPARGTDARDLLPLLEQLRARLGQEAGRDRAALHQGHRHQAQDRPHLPHGPAAGQVRLRGADPGRPRPRRDAHALPVALRAAARGRLRRGDRAREAVWQGDRVRRTRARTSRGCGARCLSTTACSWPPTARTSSRRRASRCRTPGRISTRSARSSRRWGTPSASPSRRTTTRSPRPGPCCGRSAAWRSTRTARRSASTRRPPCRRSSGTRRCTATAWSPRCCRGRTRATTSPSSRARRAGSTIR